VPDGLALGALDGREVDGIVGEQPTLAVNLTQHALSLGEDPCLDGARLA